VPSPIEFSALRSKFAPSKCEFRFHSTREPLEPKNFRSRLKFPDAFERLRNMLELVMSYRYPQTPLPQSVIIGTSTPPLLCDGFFKGEGG